MSFFLRFTSTVSSWFLPQSSRWCRWSPRLLKWNWQFSRLSSSCSTEDRPPNIRWDSEFCFKLSSYPKFVPNQTTSAKWFSPIFWSCWLRGTRDSFNQDVLTVFALHDMLIYFQITWYFPRRFRTSEQTGMHRGPLGSSRRQQGPRSNLLYYGSRLLYLRNQKRMFNTFLTDVLCILRSNSQVVLYWIRWSLLCG